MNDVYHQEGTSHPEHSNLGGKITQHQANQLCESSGQSSEASILHMDLLEGVFRSMLECRLTEAGQGSGDLIDEDIDAMIHSQPQALVS